MAGTAYQAHSDGRWLSPPETPEELAKAELSTFTNRAGSANSEPGRSSWPAVYQLRVSWKIVQAPAPRNPGPGCVSKPQLLATASHF